MGQFRATRGHDAAAGQNVYLIGFEFVEKAAVVSDDENAEIVFLGGGLNTF